MSLLFNMLSRLVITFLPKSKHLLISWLQSPSAVILEPRKIKSATVSTVSPSICHEVMGPDAMILVFWMLSFKKNIKSTVLMFYIFKSFFISSYSLHILRSSHSEVYGFSDWAHPLLSLSFWTYILSLGNAFLSFVYWVKSMPFLQLSPNRESFPISPRPTASLSPWCLTLVFCVSHSTSASTCLDHSLCFELPGDKIFVFIFGVSMPY